MYFLASICLLNFLTVRGTEEEKTIQEKMGEKTKNDKDIPKVDDDKTYKQCVTDYEAKYKNTTWDENKIKAEKLQKACEDQEKSICGTSNPISKKYVEELKGDEKEIAVGTLKIAKETCKTALIGNDNCKADCEKLSSASTVTTTVRGVDEAQTAQDKLGIRMGEIAGKVFVDPAYVQCVKAAEQKYITDKVKWDKDDKKGKNLQTACIDFESSICAAENHLQKTFDKELKGQDKEIRASAQKAAVISCKTALIGNDNCKADCEKLSSASTVTTTVLFALSTLAFLSK